jgi:WD40 repeat protein
MTTDRLSESSASDKYDIFISYSRSDSAFAERLHGALDAYTPPADLDVPQRRLRVFRDVSDLTGNDYFRAIDEHLDASQTLVVVCSPAARASEYVNDEIRRFVRRRSAGRIVPLLLSGVPNNEATGAQADSRAFPEALCEVLELPLALSYVGFDAARQRADEAPFLDSWYGLLANVYGMSRSKIEARDKKKREMDQAALARELTGTGIEVLARDPELAQLLAAHALWATCRDGGAAIREAEEFMHRALHYGSRHRTAPARRLEGHQGAVWDVRFSADGALLATASEDQHWALWKVSGELIGATAGTSPIGAIKSVRFHRDGSRVLTSHLAGRATLWNIADGRGLGSVFLTAQVWDADLSPDGRFIAVATTDGACTVFEIATGDIVRALAATPETPRAGGEVTPVVSVCFSPDGRRLATAGTFGHCRVWDVETGDVVARLDGHTEVVMDVAFAPDGTTIATASDDGSWRLWDSASSTQILQSPVVLSGSREVEAARAPMCVTFSPDGTRVATGHRDRVVVIAAVGSGEPQLTLSGHAGGVWGVAFSPDGRHLATASYDRTVCLWDVDDRRPVHRTFAGHSDAVAAVAFSVDGARLYTGGWDDCVRCWNAHDGTLQFRIDGQTGPVYAIAMSGDGRVFASANGNGTATIWDAHSGRPIRVFRGHDASVLGVAFGQGDASLLTAGHDGLAILWDVQTGAPLLRLAGRHDHVGGALFAGDGSRIVTIGTGGPHDQVTSRNSSGVVWDRQSGELLLSLDGHTAPLMALATSLKGTSAITGSQDHTARVWDVSTGQERATLSGHTRRLTSVAISADGRRVATGSLDATVRLWQTSALSQPVTLDHWRGEVWSVAFSPDGRWLAVGGKDRPVVVYPLGIEALIGHARWQSRHRPLTREECRTYFGRDDCPILPE